MSKAFTMTKILKYEFLNVLRNRWLVLLTIIVAGTTFALQRITGDFHKTIVTLSTLSVVFVPLIVSVFTSLYWYYSDRFTQLMITQPIAREKVFYARFLALTATLGASVSGGILLGSLISFQLSVGLLLLILINLVLTIIFVGIAMAIVTRIDDRMKGIGIVFGLWLYFSLLHDGGVLLILIALRDYPMDLAGGILGVLNPMGLGRVVLLMYNDAALLLGHTGAMTREIMSSGLGYLFALLTALVWMIVPFVIGIKKFRKKDFQLL